MARNIINNFVYAWHQVFEMPLPVLSRRVQEIPEDTHMQSTLRVYYPAVGAALGVLIYTAGWIASVFPGNPSASVIFPAFAVLFIEYAFGGKNLNMMTAFLESRLAGLSFGDALASLGSGQERLRSNLGIITLIFTTIYRAACFGMLMYYDRVFWIITVLAGSLAVKAHLEAQADEDSNTDMIWLSTGIIILATGLSCIPGAIAGIAISWIFAAWFNKRCVRHDVLITGAVARLASSYAEIILLTAGIILLIRR